MIYRVYVNLGGNSPACPPNWQWIVREVFTSPAVG